MTYTRTAKAIRLLPVIILSAVCACAAEKSESHSGKKNEKDQQMATRQEQSTSKPNIGSGVTGDISQFATTGCDDALWNHVYNPTRLQKLAPCVSATGIVDESIADDDGDQHFLLKLDPGQDALVIKRNRKKKNGNLVVEIVCAHSTSLHKAKSACAGYTNRIAVPQVGAHVKATGTYVIDSHNGWTEIHPVSKVERM